MPEPLFDKVADLGDVVQSSDLFYFHEINTLHIVLVFILEVLIMHFVDVFFLGLVNETFKTWKIESLDKSNHSSFRYQMLLKVIRQRKRPFIARGILGKTTEKNFKYKKLKDDFPQKSTLSETVKQLEEINQHHHLNDMFYSGKV